MEVGVAGGLVRFLGVVWGVLVGEFGWDWGWGWRRAYEDDGGIGVGRHFACFGLRFVVEGEGESCRGR